ncbi:MAG: chemotaxis protein CheX [Desulfobulbaceae bacterium]|nr:chemotaxis protein CheX [Desulfobulbaceae bacterium]
MSSLEKYITEAALEVFAAMIFIDITPGEPLTGRDDTIDSSLTSMIGLAGDLRGVLAVHCPEGAATGITGAMLGVDLDEIDEDVKDAIGEIANIVAGGLKTALLSEGTEIELAIPTTAVGKSIRTSGFTGASRFIIPFTTPAGNFGIELRYVTS